MAHRPWPTENYGLLTSGPRCLMNRSSGKRENVHTKRDGAYYLPKRCVTSSQTEGVRQLSAAAGAAPTTLAA